MTLSLSAQLTVLVLSLYLLPQVIHAQELFSCNFDLNLCTFEQDIDDDLNWARRIDETPTSDTGPSGPHMGDGYAYMESSSPAEPGDTARIFTPALEYTGSVCLRYWYHMYGANINKLEVFRRNIEGQRMVVSEISGAQGNQWRSAEVTITLMSSSDRIGFEAFRGDDFRGDIAIDTVTINRGSCVGTVVTLPFECSFETATICNFRQRTDDQFDWRRISGSTPTENSGPDEASNGEYYMYIEASDPRENNDRAILETPQIDASGATCVEFSYHMYGENINTLSLYTTSRGMTEPWRVISERNVNMWMTEKVQLELQNSDRVGFIGTRGNGVEGDIAIDNIRISSGQCDGTLPFTCSFETDLCMMFQRTADNFDWTRQSGSTDSEGTGPSSARLGTWYVYAEASSPRQPNDRAYIETPSLLYSGSICVSFYYHMYENPTSDQMGVLNIYRYRDEVGDTSLFTREGNQGSTWQQADITTEIQERDKIVFAATRGRDIRSDIAIDGLVISAGSCESQTPSPTPSPGTTPAGTEYPMYNCGAEGEGSTSSSCRMRQDTADNMQWTLMTGKTPSGRMYDINIDGEMHPVTGPEGAAVGNSYLYIEASAKTAGQLARLFLEGSDFTRSGDVCLNFQYSMNGFHIGELRVYVIQNGVREVKWRLAGNQQPGWKRAAVMIDMSGVTQIGIEATVGAEFSGDIAIDDIRMNSGRCESTPSGYIWQCNFEIPSGASTFCNMEQDTTDTSGFDWLLWTGMTPSKETGPERAQSGDYYIYIEASQPRQNGDRASILVPVLNRSGTVCVQYYYNMNGFHMGSLQVYIRRGNSNLEPISTLTGNKGSQWVQNSVTINNLQTSDKIAFRGIKGTEFSSDIAIDSIRIRSGAC